MSKKGVFGLEEIFGLYVIVFLVLLFFLFIGFKGITDVISFGPSEETIRAIELQADKEYTTALMKTLIGDVSGEETFVDLVSYSVANKDYAGLGNELERIFNGTSYFWSFSVADYENPAVVYYSKISKGYYSNNLREPIQEIVIPKYKEEGKIIVKIKITEGVLI